jgi:hypothetical protein
LAALHRRIGHHLGHDRRRFRTSGVGRQRQSAGVTPLTASRDEINIYDTSISLVDRLTYGDENIPGSIRTDVQSGSRGQRSRARR